MEAEGEEFISDKKWDSGKPGKGSTRTEGSMKAMAGSEDSWD